MSISLLSNTESRDCRAQNILQDLLLQKILLNNSGSFLVQLRASLYSQITQNEEIRNSGPYGGSFDACCL